MENVLTHLSTDNFEIKLTEDKIFLNSSTSNETFALRSINGIGVIDLIDDYNNALTKWKDHKNSGPTFYVFAGIFLIGGIYLLTWMVGLGIFTVVMAGLFARMGYVQVELNKKNEPKLMSAVRIMMNSGNRDFQFDKTGIKSGSVAEFVSKVESTLTSYHKNNN
jgi:hypothetical protein